MVSVGAIFNPYQWSPREFRAAVEAAEESGVAQLWLWEDCFRESAFASSAAALAWSEKLVVGLGIAPAPLRNVAATAMEIATVAQMFPGRFLPGLGHGVQEWMAQVGARVGSPLTLLREQLTALRALLAGEEVSVRGRYVQLDAVRLDWLPETVPPLLAAGVGPRTLALTGEVADGTIFVPCLSRSELVEQIALVHRAAQGAGRPRPRISVYVLAAFGDGALERARRELGERSPQDARAALGSVEEVAAVVASLAEIGVDDVALCPAPGEPDLLAFLRRAAAVGRLLEQA